MRRALPLQQEFENLKGLSNFDTTASISLSLSSKHLRHLVQRLCNFYIHSLPCLPHSSLIPDRKASSVQCTTCLACAVSAFLHHFCPPPSLRRPLSGLFHKAFYTKFVVCSL